MSKKLSLAGGQQSAEQIAQWVEQFHRDGFLLVENVLPRDWCAQLRADLDRALADNPNGLNNYSEYTKLAHRLFETSEANLRLFDIEPIVSFAEALVAPNCHVIHNNSFQTLPAEAFRRGIRTMLRTTSSQTASRRTFTFRCCSSRPTTI